MALEQPSSQRQIRFGELVRSIISGCLLKADFYNTEIPMTSITISFVKMSKDLRNANVYFIPLGGRFKGKLLVTLNEQKYIIQKCLASAKLQSKFTPKINFFIDDSFDEAEKISNLLLDKKVSRDLQDE